MCPSGRRGHLMRYGVISQPRRRGQAGCPLVRRQRQLGRSSSPTSRTVLPPRPPRAVLRSAASTRMVRLFSSWRRASAPAVVMEMKTETSTSSEPRRSSLLPKPRSRFEPHQRPHLHRRRHGIGHTGGSAAHGMRCAYTITTSSRTARSCRRPHEARVPTS